MRISDWSSDVCSSDLVFTDVSAAIPETPLTLKAHYGYTDGSLGGLNGSYSDWSIGASASWKALNFGVSYVDTSISKGDDLFMDPTRNIAQAGVVFSIGASFYAPTQLLGTVIGGRPPGPFFFVERGGGARQDVRRSGK